MTLYVYQKHERDIYPSSISDQAAYFWFKMLFKLKSYLADRHLHFYIVPPKRDCWRRKTTQFQMIIFLLLSLNNTFGQRVNLPRTIKLL